MSKSSNIRRCLLGSMAGVGLLATAGMGTAHATTVDADSTTKVGVKVTCVTVPVATDARVAARLQVSGPVSSTTSATANVSTKNVVVCVNAAADAIVTLDAQAQLGDHGTTVSVNAAVRAGAAASNKQVTLTVNGNVLLQA